MLADDLRRIVGQVKVTLQYFGDCPSWRVLDECLQAALAQVGVPAAVSYEVIDTPARAEAVGFRGSPTILIDGRDPFEDPSLQVGLSCRLYRTPEGLQGSPTTAQLAAVLESARGSA